MIFPGVPDGVYVELAGDATAQEISGTGGLKTQGLLEGGTGVKVSGNSTACTDGLALTNNRQVNLRANDVDIIKLNPSDSYNLAFAPKVTGTGSGYGYGIVFNPELSGSFTTEVNLLRTQPKIKDLTTPILNYFSSTRIDDPATNIGSIRGFIADGAAFVGTNNNYGFVGSIAENGDKNFNFIATSDAPNFFKGDTYIGGSISRNTFDLWKSTLTEEQLEQYEAGTFTVPANVSLPGDGSFARSWYYDQQDAETQALLDSGSLEYPTHLAAATFNDTFALGVTTNINLNAGGLGEFKGGVAVSGGGWNTVKAGMWSTATQDFLALGTSNEARLKIQVDGVKIPAIDGTDTTALSVEAASTQGSATIKSYSSYLASATSKLTKFIGYSANANTLAPSTENIGFEAVAQLASDNTDSAYGFKSYLNKRDKTFAFYSDGDADSFHQGDIYIGGNTTRNTLELWKSTLTKERLDDFHADKFVAPANVSNPGDGEYVRQWYYDQQDKETQALLASGELEYPTHLAAATFTDTFDLGDNTNINLNAGGLGEFKGGVRVSGGLPSTVENGLFLYDGYLGVALAEKNFARFGYAFGTERYGVHAAMSHIVKDGITKAFGFNANTAGIDVTTVTDVVGYKTQLIKHQKLQEHLIITWDFMLSKLRQKSYATNAYGFYTDISDSNADNAFGFYSANSAPNYFNGGLQFDLTHSTGGSQRQLQLDAYEEGCGHQL